MTTAQSKAHRRGWKRTEGNGRTVKLTTATCQACALPWSDTVKPLPPVCPECRYAAIKKARGAGNL